jgi:hypothetical protein
MPASGFTRREGKAGCSNEGILYIHHPKKNIKL